MKTMLRLEELGIFLLCLMLFHPLPYVWWSFPALLLFPDLSMLGYLGGPKVGARIYNFFHHRLLAIVVLAVGWHLGWMEVRYAGLILLAHISMDRFFGYGFKHDDNFKHTHLGWIGPQDEE